MGYVVVKQSVNVAMIFPLHESFHLTIPLSSSLATTRQLSSLFTTVSIIVAWYLQGYPGQTAHGSLLALEVLSSPRARHVA
jgi:hypothetical protein